MRGAPELNPYELAYICGGPERVAMVALVALHEDGQITISSARHRVSAVRRAPRDSVETAALEAIPSAGKVLGQTVQAIVKAQAVREVGRTLRAERLLPDSRLSALWQWGRIRASRDLRRRMTERADPGLDGLSEVVVRGAPGIADSTIRQVFQTPDPPQVKLPRVHRGRPHDLDSSNTSGGGGYDGGDSGGGGY